MKETDDRGMHLAEIAFFTDDVARMTVFYRSLLGGAPVHASDGTAIFLVGGTRVFIHKTYMAGEGELPPENHVAFAVDNLDATCESLTAQGVELEVEPREFYWGRSAYVRAPDGQLIELVEKMKETGS